MRKLRLIIALFILCSLIFNFTDEAPPPPYHQFRLTGKIICDTLTDKSNYTVTLYGKSEFTYDKYQKAFRYPDGIENLALTDSTGYYLLIASNEFEFDSIMTAVILPGKEPIFSEAVYVDKSNRIEIKKYIDGYDDKSGCCENQVTPQNGSTVIERYEYDIRDITIKLCE